MASSAAALATFAAGIAFGAVAAVTARVVLALGPGQVVPAVALATAAALVIDGTVFMWVPGLYHANPEIWRPAAAVILWGAGWGIVFAFVFRGR